MTFSIAGYCAQTGMFGVAVSTSSLAVGGRCSFAKAKTGAALIQNYADPSLGPVALQALSEGKDAQATVDHLVSVGHGIAWRQIMVVDGNGGTAHFDGENCADPHRCAETTHCVAGGNILATADVAQATVDGFDAADPGLHLGERLLLALEAGLAKGGEANPERSAHLLVVDELGWPPVDLRVDMHEEPVAELRRVWEDFRPEMLGFVARAVDPASAPKHGEGEADG
tara:strand:+ start:9252 stop:9932 length:681 start_codon:yes stop_codon:yes gene_type:complete